MSCTATIRRHLRFGWLALVVFVLAGVTLEAMHGFKVAWYLDVGNETRRLLWRLAHAHGAVLAILNLVFATTLAHLECEHARWRRVASPCLVGATIAVPAGFFLGGFAIHGGDPGPGVVVLPIGAALLVAAVGATAWGAYRQADDA
ncbi:MAG: hypothetical protein KDB80_14480 [Planctomycetes bacterium]|nr:hypothetical protein [Planctomycetota bacterium]